MLLSSLRQYKALNQKKLGALVKDSSRTTMQFSLEQQTIAIPQIRHLNRGDITPAIKLFSKCLVQNKERPSFLLIYLSYLKLQLERRKRLSIQNMQDTSSTLDTYDQIEDNLFLEIEHLFREIAHICDSIYISNISCESIDFPKVNDLVEVVSCLMVHGYIFELLDGEHFYIPIEWTRQVLGEVNRKINEKQLFVLSILGIQSSGKSTLLNTMLGLQFPASCGRCTRGIHMRLVPLLRRKSMCFDVPFEYILVIDTEGIRAPEFLDTHESYYRRDNELSMIITGLGDVTILNVMGESITEMHDVLQILAHAFLRLKSTNNSLDIRKSCFLIHQNVSELLAPVKLKSGLKHALQILDKATKEAAEFEGISDITTFQDVIKFNGQSNVFYFPNLWHGNPPMASVNRKYCDRVDAMKERLFKESLSDRGKSFKTLEDIGTHVRDLWKGVLAENFVFSFRNNIEKKAYIEMEKFLRDLFWSLETCFDDETVKLVQNEFAICDDFDILKLTKSRVTNSLTKMISKHKQNANDNMEVFFQENQYREMTIRWKSQSFNRLDMFCHVIVDNRKIEIDNFYERRKVDILITKMCTKHEDELRKRSIDLANELRSSGIKIDSHESIAKFDDIWKIIVAESFNLENTKPENKSLKNDFVLCLQNIFESHIVSLNPFLKDEKFNEELEIKCLSGSFAKTEISTSDISICSHKKRILKNHKGSAKSSENSERKLRLVESASEEIFRIIDTKVQIICQKNEIITNRDVKQVMNEAYKLFDDISTRHSQHYTLKKTFQIKILVHISKFLLQRFESKNSLHQKSHSLTARLESYRKQMQERFYAYLEERKAEDTAACLMHAELENLIKENIEDNLTRKVKFALKDRLPPLKYYLLLNLLCDLIHKNDFDEYKSYILHPEGHAVIWVTQKANKCLFEEKMYSEVAEREVSYLFEDIKCQLRNSLENFHDNRAAFKEWILNFKSINNTITFSNNCFSNVSKELDQLEYVEIVDFVNKITEKLDKSEKALIDMYRNATEKTVRWNGKSPIDTLIEDIWGCSELCLFCGEPCIKWKVHDDTCHICLQHRPLGVSGCFNDETGNIILTSCHVNVTQSADVSCCFIDFRCNPQVRKECKEKRHEFKDYKSIASTWDIEPASLMENCSLFWMMFMGKFKRELSEYYGINTENIPQIWNDIQDERAISSLVNSQAAKKFLSGLFS